MQGKTDLSIGLPEGCDFVPLPRSVDSHKCTSKVWLVLQDLQGGRDKADDTDAGKTVSARIASVHERSIGRSSLFCTSAPATKTAAIALSNSAKAAGRR